MSPHAVSIPLRDVSDAQADLDFARYELSKLLSEILIKVNSGVGVPLTMKHQQIALESEIDGLVNSLTC